MLLECACGKMYRIKDDAANPPTKCPSCGGTLKASGGAAPTGGGRLKEVESRLQAVERERASLKATLELKDKDLQDAQSSISRLGTDLERAQNTYKEALRKKDDELEEKHKKISELEGGTGTKVRPGMSQAQTLALLKAKDDALQEARERISTLEEETAGKEGGSPDKVAQLQHDLQEAQASISRLGSDLEQAQKTYQEALRQKDADLEERQQRVVALERQAASAGARTPAPTGPPGSELARAQARLSQLERIVQDGEQRYRALHDKMEKLQEGGATDSRTQTDALAEKDRAIAELRQSAAAEKSRAEELQKQLQEARRATKARPKEEAAPTPPAIPARLGEARYLAADLDKSLSSVGSALSALVERVKRLNDSLQGAETSVPSGAVPGAPVWGKAPDEPAPAHAAAAPPPADDVATLEGLPEPVLQDDDLPADETLLDMGKMGHQVRAGVRRREETFEPPPGLEEPEPQPLDEVPLSAETSPGPVPEEGEPEPEAESEPPKKKGLFGKLFGKKK